MTPTTANPIPKRTTPESALFFPALVFAILIFWSSAYIGIRIALNGYSPGNLGFLRYFIASFLFIVLALFNKVRIPALRDLPVLSVLGFLGFTCYNLLLNYGETTVSAGIASLTINTVPFFSLLIGVLTKKESAGKKDWSGLIVGFLGVAVIVLFQSTRQRAIDWHVLLILGAAICQSLYFSIQKEYFRKYSPLELTSYAVWTGTIVLYFFAKDPFYCLFTTQVNYTVAVIYLGVFPGAIAFLLVGLALKQNKVSNFSPYLFLIPLITLLIAWLTIGEAVPLTAAIGGSLIIAGILIKNNRLRFQKASPHPNR